MIATKRAYEPPAKADGVRILVDRGWPRTRYRKELAAAPAREARDAEHDNAAVIADVIARRLKRTAR